MRLADGITKTLDFRETAPAAAFKDMYLDSAGNPDFEKSLRGHLAAGIPGTVAGIFESMRYAKLPFKKLIQPAIDLAGGYVLTYRFGFDIGMGLMDPKLNTRPNVFIDPHDWKEGEVFRQPDLAKTLKRIRDHGRRDFYEGKTAQLIVDEMKRGGGIITKEDLKKYRAVWRTPQTFKYRDYDIISMSLPSSGGILLNQMLKMIEPYPVGSYGRGSTAAINLMVEAMRRAYRNRSLYLGDSDFSNVPVNQLVSDSFIKKQMADFIPGTAGVSEPLSSSAATKKESMQTTHLSVVDKEGNAVAITTTLNGPYGCGVVVGDAGFFLNNEMNDFNIKTGVTSFFRRCWGSE